MSQIFAIHTDAHANGHAMAMKGEIRDENGKRRFWICFCHFTTFICHINGCKRRKIMSLWMDRVVPGVGTFRIKLKNLVIRKVCWHRFIGNCLFFWPTFERLEKELLQLFVTKRKIDSSNRHSNKSNAIFDVSFILRAWTVLFLEK